MLEALPRREREILDTLYSLGEASAGDIMAAMADPPSNSAVRAMLTRLETKGVIKHRLEQQRYIYVPALPKRTARRPALDRLVQSFFGGSPTSAATALLGMADRVDAEELQKLEELVKKIRKKSR
jgi:predicted transcriptional regulator